MVYINKCMPGVPLKERECGVAFYTDELELSFFLLL